MKALKNAEDPELLDRFNRVLRETIEALEETGVHFVFIGGIASGGLGRPRGTHDIDVFVRPEDAEITLRSLAKKGFKTERTDPNWLYKGFKENVLVDVIFKSKGEIYLDSEMYNRMITAEYHGMRVPLVAPEDLVIIKATAHSEMTPGHWHDALGLLSHASLDWDYLIRRARRAPRRVLSLLLYAQSNDIWVPNQVIHELYRGIFSDTAATAPVRPMRGGLRQVPSATSAEAAKFRQFYGVAHLRESLAEDPRINELDIQIEQAEGKILLRGEVPNVERREAAAQLAREVFPDCVIENQIRVEVFPNPVESEEVK